MRALLINACETDLLRRFVAYGVQFLVVGGHAVQFHGHLRPAKDLDVFIDPASENPVRVVNALAALNIANSELTAERLSKPKQQIRIGGWYNTELLTSLHGVTFTEAYADRQNAMQQDLLVPVVSRHHLIQSKRALGRPQDLEDVTALEKSENAV